MEFRTIGERIEYEREPEVWECDMWDSYQLDCDIHGNIGMIEYYGLIEDISYKELMKD